MNVLAINGSPHMDEGNTEMILNPFLAGMKEAGASVEVFYTRKLKTGPCNGDMSCWFKNPEECCSCPKDIERYFDIFLVSLSWENIISRSS